MSVGNEQADAGGRPNPSRQTKFSGANGDKGNIRFPCSADREQDWQPYPVDPNSAICDEHAHSVVLVRTFDFKYRYRNCRHPMNNSFDLIDVMVVDENTHKPSQGVLLLLLI